MTTSPITTHVLDTALGAPAAGVRVELRRGGKKIASGTTNASGRISDLLPAGPIEPGVYEIVFDTGSYAATRGGKTFYPGVTIQFTIEKSDEHFHVPLILSPYGYSTYRGS